MSLFIETTPEKIAAIELEEDTTQWPRQVLVELYRTMPDTADYSPEVKFLRIDEEQGYAIGLVVLSSATNSALASEPVAAVAKKAMVPIIIKNHTLCPLDIVIAASGKMYPLTEERLREVLYRPETFDLVTNDYNNQSIWGLFAPPGRSDIANTSGIMTGGSGAQVITGPGMKMGSFEMLEALSGTLLEPDIKALEALLDPGFMKLASKNLTYLEALRLLSEQPVVTLQDKVAMQDVSAHMHAADVVQLSGSDGIYCVKSANREHGELRIQERMNRGEFLKFAGAELTKRVDTEGTLTVAQPSVVVVASANGEAPRVIDNSRAACVYDAGNGKEYMGWVLWGLMDTDGNRTPTSLFVNDTIRTYQNQIVGGYSYGDRIDLPNDPAQGLGCFYASPEAATVPVKVTSAERVGDTDVTYHCIDLTGEQLRITLSKGTRSTIAFPKDKELLMPLETKFISLEGKKSPALVSQGVPGHQMTQALDKTAEVRYASHGVYEFRGCTAELWPGGANWEDKTASLALDSDHAMLLLCLGGLGVKQAAKVLFTAEKLGKASFPLQAFYRDNPVDTTVQEKVAAIHALRRPLVKDAAALPDVMTVDAVLSLGFMNSENVDTFVTQIPYLEKALNQVCEFVLATRLGLSEIPEPAAVRCSKALNDVLQGLKALALREIRDVA